MVEARHEEAEPLVTTDGADLRRTMAREMAGNYGHLFPGTSPYWRFRTFQRLLSDQSAIDFFDMMEQKPGMEDNGLQELAAYDGVLELVHGQTCLRSVRAKMEELQLGHDKYVWEDFEPDTLKSACEYLMAHKEPYGRFTTALSSGDIIDLDGDTEESKDPPPPKVVPGKDPWTLSEFDVLNHADHWLR